MPRHTVMTIIRLEMLLALLYRLVSTFYNNVLVNLGAGISSSDNAHILIHFKVCVCVCVCVFNNLELKIYFLSKVI